MIIALASFTLGMFVFYTIHKVKTGGFHKLGEEILARAQTEADKKEASFALELKKRESLFQQGLEKQREKFLQREERLDRQLELSLAKLVEISQREKVLCKVEEQKREVALELERISQLTHQEAEALLLERVSQKIEQQTAKIALRRKKEAEEEGNRIATGLITTAINRLTLPTLSQISLVTVALPNQEMKGRVIGREGRNIRALEQLTGVTFALDDTPNAIVISGFDPIRKEVAKRALKELIQDGRIHPTRIEEVVLKMQQEVEEQIHTYGREGAARALGGVDLHPELLKLLGKLNFRFSYGQNILEHSLEVSYLMGMLASELGLDSPLARRIGLLHDIGKAVSHEIEGSHALIGRDIALKYGESEAVANGIGSHHEEIPPFTVEGSLCEPANKISGGRLGARVEALEHYVKRSSRLEQLAAQFEGVEQAYALQSGQEVRVIVEPERFDDRATIHLARKIAEKIESELSYSGKIKVTLIREKRVIEYAV